MLVLAVESFELVWKLVLDTAEVQGRSDKLCMMDTAALLDMKVLELFRNFPCHILVERRIAHREDSENRKQIGAALLAKIPLKLFHKLPIELPAQKGQIQQRKDRRCKRKLLEDLLELFLN